MIESVIIETIITNGILGIVCAFFMLKDIRKDAKIVSTLDKLTTIIDERLPKR